MSNLQQFQISSYYFLIPAIVMVILIVLAEKKPFFKKIIPDFLKTGVSFYAILTLIFGLITSVVRSAYIFSFGLEFFKLPLISYCVKFFFIGGWVFTMVFWLAAGKHIRKYKLKGVLLAAIGFIPSTFLVFYSENILATLIVILLIATFYSLFWFRSFLIG